MSIIKQISKSVLQGPIYILVFGLIFFSIGTGPSIKQLLIEYDGGQAAGEVIRLNDRCDDDGCTYAPVVRFTLQTGNQITFESAYSSSPPAYEVGERVTVLFPSEAPEKAEIKGAGKALRITFAVTGGIILCVGMYMFYRNLRAEISAPETFPLP
jgi:hypothetical protein